MDFLLLAEDPTPGTEKRLSGWKTGPLRRNVP